MRFTQVIVFSFVSFAVATDLTAQGVTAQYVYLVRIPATTQHGAAIQTGFRIKGTKGIVTALHGVADGNSFSAVNENNDVLRDLTIQAVDVQNDLALLASEELYRRTDDGLAISDALPPEG